MGKFKRYFQDGIPFVAAILMLEAVLLYFTLTYNSTHAHSNVNLTLLYIEAVLVVITCFIIIKLVKVKERTEFDLEKNKGLLDTFFSVAADGIILMGRNGEVFDINPEAEKIFGYNSSQVKGERISFLLAPFHGDEYDCDLSQSPPNGKEPLVGGNREVTGQKQDGTFFPIGISISEVKVEGEYVYCGIVRDLSERKAVQQNLLQQKNYLELAERVAEIGHWNVALKTGELYWSDEIYRIHGLSPAEYTPDVESAIAFYHPDDQPIIEEAVEKALNERSGFSLKLRIIRGDGEERHVFTKGECQFNSDENVSHVFGVFQDITESVMDEQRLREGEKQLTLALEGGGLGIWDWNSITQTIQFSGEWFSMLGYADDEFPHEHETWQKLVHPEDREHVEKQLLNYLKGNAEHYEAEMRMRHKSGDWRWILSKGKLFEHDENGLPTRIVGTHADISEHKQLVAHLTESNDQLERFAYICSHDLQEPLRMINSFSSKLESYLLDSLQGDEKGQRYLHHITNGAERAQQLIADILSYSRLDQDDAQLETVALDEILGDLKASLADKILELDARISYSELPVVFGNKTQLHQLFSNLVSNGLKYKALDTKPQIKIYSKETPSHWHISISDNGIGIDEKHNHRIFDVFQRLHRKEEYPGTGIGLAICKKVVERHNGRIWVDSAKGMGSTFHFTLEKKREMDG